MKLNFENRIPPLFRIGVDSESLTRLSGTLGGLGPHKGKDGREGGSSLLLCFLRLLAQLEPRLSERTGNFLMSDK